MYIREIDSLHNYLLIISVKDEVLNHELIFQKVIESNQLIISKNDNHQLLNFFFKKNIFYEIENYITLHINT